MKREKPNVDELPSPSSLTPWPTDPKKKEIGELSGRDMHGAIDAAVKMLYATSLPPEDTQAYIDACQNNLRDLSLKVNHSW